MLQTLRITARSSTKVASEDRATRNPKGPRIIPNDDGTELPLEIARSIAVVLIPRAAAPLAKAGTEPNCKNM